MKGRVAVLALAATMFWMSPASACIVTPPPVTPPGLSADAYYRWLQSAFERERTVAIDQKVSRQNYAWGLASVVLIARLEDTPLSMIKRPGGSDFVEVRDAMLRPVRWLKGESPARSFRIGPQGFSGCSVDPYWSDIEGDIGSLFVVFAAGSAPSQNTILDVIPVGNIVRDDVRSSLPPFQ